MNKRAMMNMCLIFFPSIMNEISCLRMALPVSLPEDKFCRSLASTPRMLHKHYNDAVAGMWEEFERSYALNASVLAQGTKMGDVSAMQSILRKLANKKKVNVFTFGNSMMQGTGCSEVQPQTRDECSWSKRAGNWMKYAFPEADIEWKNLAESGVGTKGHLALLGGFAQTYQPDLVILDFVLSDMKEDQKGVYHEKMILTLKQVWPKAQILSAEAYTAEYPGSDQVKDLRSKINAHYHIPVMDYFEMVRLHNKAQIDGPDRLWPTIEPKKPALAVSPPLGAEWPNLVPKQVVTDTACCPTNHPPWSIHQYYADAVAHVILSMLERVCAGQDVVPFKPDTTYAKKAELDEIPVCYEPKSLHKASKTVSLSLKNSATPLLFTVLSNDFKAKPTVLSGDWEIYEDKPGRPGWISKKKGSQISFPLQFGVQPTLIITHLKSYEGFGAATMHIQTPSESSVGVRLDGQWDTHYSLPVSTSFIYHHGDLTRFRGVTNSSVGAKVNLTITNEMDQKFKILAVLSC